MASSNIREDHIDSSANLSTTSETSSDSENYRLCEEFKKLIENTKQSGNKVYNWLMFFFP